LRELQRKSALGGSKNIKEVYGEEAENLLLADHEHQKAKSFQKWGTTHVSVLCIHMFSHYAVSLAALLKIHCSFDGRHLFFGLKFL
jgi:hypothetical protein